MRTWKAMAVACGLGVLALASLEAQQKSAASKATALTALDYIQIQQLAQRHSFALDSAADNGRVFASLFAQDGVFVPGNGTPVSGRDALEALARRTSQGPLSLMHFVMNHAIEPTPEGAVGIEYVAEFTFGEKGERHAVSGGGHYHSTYVKTPDGWRFKRRQFFPSFNGPQPGYHPPMFTLPVQVADQAASADGSLTPADYIQIQQLAARYPYGLDTGQRTGYLLADLFLPDGLFESGRKIQGREALKAFAYEHREGQGPSYMRNFSSANQVIEKSAEGASGLTYAMQIDIGVGGKASQILNGARYLDTYVKTADGWRIKKREVSYTEPGPPPSPRKAGSPNVPRSEPVPLVRPKGGKAMPLTARDYIEIQQLTARYSHALDTAADNGYAYADLFVPDAIAFDKYVGREQIAEVPRWNPHGPKYVRHYAMPALIEATADGAIGKQYVVVVDIGPGGKGSSVYLGAQYQDVYVKTAQGWRFKSRTEFDSKKALAPQTARAQAAR